MSSPFSLLPSPLTRGSLLSWHAPVLSPSLPLLPSPRRRWPSAQPALVATLGELSRLAAGPIQKVSASVVQIFVTGYAPPDEDDPQGAGQPTVERSSGSGVIVDADGYIVTNAHVVENATRIEVDLPFAAISGNPGRSILGRRGRTVGAQIVAIDRETDIAVVKIEAKGLPVLGFGDSDALRPGRWSSRSAARSGSTRR